MWAAGLAIQTSEIQGISRIQDRAQECVLHLHHSGRLVALLGGLDDLDPKLRLLRGHDQRALARDHLRHVAVVTQIRSGFGPYAETTISTFSFSDHRRGGAKKTGGGGERTSLRGVPPMRRGRRTHPSCSPARPRIPGSMVLGLLWPEALHRFQKHVISQTSKSTRPRLTLHVQPVLDVAALGPSHDEADLLRRRGVEGRPEGDNDGIVRIAEVHDELGERYHEVRPSIAPHC